MPELMFAKIFYLHLHTSFCEVNFSHKESRLFSIHSDLGALVEQAASLDRFNAIYVLHS